MHWNHDFGGLFGGGHSFSWGGGGSAPGETLTAPDNNGSTLTGGAGNDTLVASYGPDVLTGGAGADTFSFPVLPWTAGHVTDFTPGQDHLDLSALFAQSGYTGHDPVGDGYLSFSDDGAGGTKVWLDIDGPSSDNPWPFLITDLDHVAPGQIDVARDVDITPPASSGGGSAGGWGGLLSTLFSKLESHFPALQNLHLDSLFQQFNYHGTHPVADGVLNFTADSHGGTQVWFDPDGSSGPASGHLLGDFQHLSFSSLHADHWGL